MDISKLNKAYQLLIDLTEIEESKEEIQKMADILANNDTENDFQLTVEVKKEVEEEIITASEFGNKMEIAGLAFFSPQSDAYKFIQRQKKELNNDNECKIDFRISSKVSLQMLGLMLCELNLKEDSILKEMGEIGVTRKNKKI